MESNWGNTFRFYFGVRTPMLYVMQNGFNLVAPTPAENIVYCITSVQKIIDLQLDFIFTDGHAVDRFTSQFTRDNVDKLDKILDWKAITAKYWHNDNDLDFKRRKEAEFLVLGDIPKNAVLGFVVYNQNSKNKLINFGINGANIIIKHEYYF